MTSCGFCGRKLPEGGQSHYMVVVTRFGDSIPCCVACLKAKKYKPAALVKSDGD